MPLSVRSSYEELQHQLEELREQGYFYTGEYVFAGDNNTWNKIDTDAFHLGDIPYAGALDRVVMLFSTLSGNRAVMLEIEGRRVYRVESGNGRFLMDSFVALGEHFVDQQAEPEDGLTFDLSYPVRLIYRKPLFLMLLFQCNLIWRGHNLRKQVYLDPERRAVEIRKERDTVEVILGELRSYFALDSCEERADFRDTHHDHDEPTKQIWELAGYLTGLKLIRSELPGKRPVEDTDGELDAWKQYCRRIEALILVLQDKLRILEVAAGMEIPYTSPEKSIALWHKDEHFAYERSFSEQSGIRSAVVREIDRMVHRRPEGEGARLRLWEYRMEMLYQQLREIEDLFGRSIYQEIQNWKDYLV